MPRRKSANLKVSVVVAVDGVISKVREKVLISRLGGFKVLGAMAWGYWSATAVDRGRSPRRNTQQQQQQQQYPYQNQNYQQYSLAQSQHQQSTQCLNSCPQAAEPPPPVPPQQQPIQQQQQPIQQQQQQQQQVCGSPCHSPCHSPQFIEQIPPDLPCTPVCTYSRRQSLDSPQVDRC